MVSKKFTFQGSYVAIVTPFTIKGKIDRKALEALVQWHVFQGTDGLVCCGSTGESGTLSRVERKTIAQICIDASEGKLPIVVGTGTCDTRESVQMTIDAMKAGASACLATTPYYNRPTQRGCLEHFRELAKTGLSVIIHNEPERTSFAFEMETIQELAGIEGVIGFKDASGSLDFVRNFVNATSMPLISGDDRIACEMMFQGAVGSISVIGNVIPKGWRRMIRLAQEKNALARILNERYRPLCNANFFETNPQCIKYIVSQIGLCKAHYRLPFLPPSVQTQEKIKEAMLQMSIPMFLKFS